MATPTLSRPTGAPRAGTIEAPVHVLRDARFGRASSSGCLACAQLAHLPLLRPVVIANSLSCQCHVSAVIGQWLAEAVLAHACVSLARWRSDIHVAWCQKQKVHKQKQSQGCRCKRCSRIPCLIERQHPKDRDRFDLGSCYPAPPARLPRSGARCVGP